MEGSTVNVNRHRGEAALVLPDGRTVLVRLTMNVLAGLETRLDAVGELPQKLLGAGYNVVRAVFHAVLTTPPRPGERSPFPADVAIETIGDVLDELGTLGNESPVSVAYWELVVGAGFLDRAEAVKLKLLPPGKVTAVEPAGDGEPAAEMAPPAGT